MQLINVIKGINVMARHAEVKEKEIIEALRAIDKQKADFDAVVLIRGGGSKLDLSGFDSLKLCKVIANFPLPILTFPVKRFIS